jgi:hypothetical protein
MGCHTWFYKHVPSPPYEEIQKAVMKLYEKFNSVEYCVGKTLKQKQAYLALCDRQIHMIKQGLCKVAVCMRYAKWTDKIGPHVNDFVDGKGFFTKVDDYHDVFRTGWDQTRKDPHLFSLAETMEFIKNNDIYHYENSDEQMHERLQAFWAKYPDGMIGFG